MHACMLCNVASCGVMLCEVCMRALHGMQVYMYASNVFMQVGHMHACVHESIALFYERVCMYVGVCAMKRIQSCLRVLHVCVYACMCVCMWVCKACNACKYVCKYVCMHAMYVCSVFSALHVFVDRGDACMQCTYACVKRIVMYECMQWMQCNGCMYV